MEIPTTAQTYSGRGAEEEETGEVAAKEASAAMA